MKKDIKINFIFPSSEEDRKKTYDRINKFNKDIFLAYINSINCGYDEKIMIFDYLLSLKEK
jgi:hypothetical protein